MRPRVHPLVPDGKKYMHYAINKPGDPSGIHHYSASTYNGARRIEAGLTFFLSSFTTEWGPIHHGILFRSGDQLAIWHLNRARVVEQSFPGTAPNAVVAATPDVDGDGRGDIVLRQTDGHVIIRFLERQSIRSERDTGTMPSDARLEATGDFNRDGNEDLVWRMNSGQIKIWIMNDIGVVQGEYSPATLGFNWGLYGVGDFDGDGHNDMLWRSETDGQVVIWFFNDTTLLGSGTWVGGPVGLDWKIRGVGRFNADNKADILWHNDNGLVHMWFMNGAAIASQASPAQPDVAWQIKGVGDYDGDSKTDILWRHIGGEMTIWFMNGGTIAANEQAPYESNAWQLVRAIDTRR